jgi:hypothetical protein
MIMRPSNKGWVPSLSHIKTRRSAVISSKQVVLLAVLLLTTPSFAGEVDTRLSALQDCGSRDAHFLTQLEQHGERGTMPGEKLYAAFQTMLRARAACSAGRSEEGLALYDSVFGPVRDTQMGQVRGSQRAQ